MMPALMLNLNFCIRPNEGAAGEEEKKKDKKCGRYNFIPIPQMKVSKRKTLVLT